MDKIEEIRKELLAGNERIERALARLGREEGLCIDCIYEADLDYEIEHMEGE